MKIKEGSSHHSESDSSGKRRSERSHRAILNSALAILSEQGYGRLTIEGVAARAKVGKQTIYRWWPSKAAVVLEALTADTQERLPVPDTGSVRGDLETLLSNSFRVLTTWSGPIVCGLMAEAQLDPAFGRAFREDFVAQRREVMLKVLRRGQHRGEISDTVDLELIVDLIYGPMWYRLLNQHAPLDDDFARSLLDQIFTGLHQ